MIWGLLTVAILIWALWRMRSPQITYFTQDFPIDTTVTVYVDGREMKQGDEYVVADGRVIVLLEPPKDSCTLTARFK